MTTQAQVRGLKAVGLIKCLSCNHEPFETYRDLAKHIVSSRKGHRRGKRWASKYLLFNGLSPQKRRGRQTRVALTEGEKTNREDTRRELSGTTEFVTTLCIKCGNAVRQGLPAEYVQSQDAWREKGYLVAMCPVCRS